MSVSRDWNNFLDSNWDQVRERHIAWWKREGLVLHVETPRDNAALTTLSSDGLDFANISPDQRGMASAWLNPEYRANFAAQSLEASYFGGESFPFFDTHIGPGSLALMLGSEPLWSDHTVWYLPCITDPQNYPDLVFDPETPWFQKQSAILETGMDVSQGRFLVGMPDLVENIDILASLRDTQTLMMDMLDRPEFVKERVAQINEVYFAVFERFFQIIKDPWGGNAFSAFAIWGPGKTAKVQCDASAMFSPTMFAEFVVPALAEQCEWLDYSMFHLDGTQCIPHLELLLEIDSLDAIEWTPQAGIQGGGDPRWYDLYRKVLNAGKSVQAVGVLPHEVIPLLEHIGTKGVYLVVTAENESEARSLVEAVNAYR